MTRVEDFVLDVSFTQLMNEACGRRCGYNARTWNKALEADLVWQDRHGYFSLTPKGRGVLAEIRSRPVKAINQYLGFLR